MRRDRGHLWLEMGEGDRDKVRILGDGELRTMFIHEEGRREKWKH